MTAMNVLGWLVCIGLGAAFLALCGASVAALVWGVVQMLHGEL